MGIPLDVMFGHMAEGPSESHAECLTEGNEVLRWKQSCDVIVGNSDHVQAQLSLVTTEDCQRGRTSEEEHSRER